MRARGQGQMKVQCSIPLVLFVLVAQSRASPPAANHEPRSQVLVPLRQGDLGSNLEDMSKLSMLGNRATGAIPP